MRTRSARPRTSWSPTGSRRSVSRSSSATATQLTRCGQRRSSTRCWPRPGTTCRSTAPPIATRCARTSRASTRCWSRSYAAEPSRRHLQKVREQARRHGARLDLRIMASHGGTISIDARELAKTLISGPIGGVIGGGYLAGQLGTENVVCTDIGGTSFDLALITDGNYHIKNIPDIGRFLLNIPLVQVDSVGAGTGSYVRVNPSSGRIEIGPDSAGSRIGSCAPYGVETPTTSSAARSRSTSTPLARRSPSRSPSHSG